MTFNIIKYAIRSIKNQKLYSLLSIIGLAVGIACFFTIFAYIQHEKNFDRFFKDYDNIYRLIQNDQIRTSFLLYNAINTYLPESTILTRMEIYGGEIFSYKDKTLQNIKNWRADANFFNVFSFEFIQGNPESALEAPNSLVLTRSLSKRLFGEQNPVGNIVKIDNSQNYTVTAVIQDIPTNCHMQFDAILSWSRWSQNLDSWTYYGPIIYIKKPTTVPKAQLNINLNEFIKTIKNDACKKLELQQISDIHLQSQVKDEYAKVLPQIYIFLFTAIAILILLIACINIINITIAQQVQKRVQIGIRKIFNANKSSLIVQFLTESFIISLTSLLLAILIMHILNPVLQNIIGIDYQTRLWNNFFFYIFALIILVITTLLSGLYPAWLAAGTDPLTILGKSAPPKQNHIMRSILITVQFTIAIILLTTLALMRTQIHFIHNKNLGFRKDNIYMINIHYRINFDEGDYNALKDQLLQHPNISAISYGQTPVNAGGRCNLVIRKQEPGEQMSFKELEVGDNFLQTMNFELIEGRFFFPGYSDSNAIILTESTVKTLNWKNPVGKTFHGGKEVVGVIKDFNYFSLHEKQLPTYIELMEKNRFLSIIVKLNGHADFSTIKDIEKTWKSIIPAWPLDGQFLDNYIDNLYRFEVRLEHLFYVFTVLSIFLACLGLIGITAISTEQRTKEIGIRRVNGASVLHILVLFTKKITISVFVALGIAAPLAWYAMNKWLQSFAYRIDLTIWPFLLAGLAALVIALLTISFQTVRAATANPVESLRYE